MFLKVSMKILDLKSKIVKNILDGLYSRFDAVEKIISEFENRSIEIIQSE